MVQNRVRYIVEVDDKGTPTIRQVGTHMDRLEDKTKRAGSTFKSVRTHWLALTAAFAAGIYIIIRLTRSFVQAAGEAEMFQTQILAVSSSSEEATRAYKEMLDFAARTPHMTQDVVKAFIMLKSVGIEPNIQSMKTLGDVAFLFNRNIQDVGSAIISFEKEVLRRLGIEIDRVGKTARIVSGNMVIETENAAQAIRKGLLQVWETRFGGAMERAESTWAGTVALFKSGLWEMQNAIGTALLPGLKLIVQWVTNIIFRIRDWSATNKEAAQDILRRGLINIINGLELTTLAVQALIHAWLGLRQAVDIFVSVSLKAFQAVVSAARWFLEQLNIKGVLDSVISGMRELEKIGEHYSKIYMKDAERLIEKQQGVASVFSTVREAVQDLGAEVDRQWPKLTALETGIPPTGIPAVPTPVGVGMPGAAAGAELPNLEFLTEQMDALEAFHTAEMKIYDERLTAWEAERQAMVELAGSYDIVRDAWGSLIEAEDLYVSMRGAVKGAIAANILGYESLGVALRKATAQVLANLASEAAVRAILHTAMGIAALTPWGAAVYGPASAQFKAAALFGMVAIAAGAAARALAGVPGAAAAAGYQEARGTGVQELARAGEPEEAAQRIDVHIHGDIIGTEDWAENNLLPVLKKIGKRDQKISITYG